MSHPISNLYNTEKLISELENLLDIKRQKSDVLLKLSDIKESIGKQREDFLTYEMQNQINNQGYFEHIKIRYSVKYFGDNEPNSIHEREFKDYCIDMDTLKKMVRAERDLHNQNESYLTAEIFLLDADCEDEE